MDVIVEGTLSLQQQEDTLGGTENFKNVLLTKYEKLNEKNDDGTPVKNNLASLTKAKLGQTIPHLVLVEVKPTQTIAEVEATQFAAGRKLIFRSTVFVEGKLTDIAAFR